MVLVDDYTNGRDHYTENDDLTRWICPDCKLTHDILIQSLYEGVIAVGAMAHPRSTAARRRYRRADAESTYVQIYDGQLIVCRVGEIRRWACCDCSFVWRLVFMVEPLEDESQPDVLIGCIVNVNSRSTAQRRALARRAGLPLAHDQFVTP